VTTRRKPGLITVKAHENALPREYASASFFSPSAILELHSTFPASVRRAHRVLRKRARELWYQRHSGHHSGGLANIFRVFRVGEEEDDKSDRRSAIHSRIRDFD